MRTLPTLLRTIHDEGPLLGGYFGSRRVSGRVTVEPDWWLTTESVACGSWPSTKRPIRWWQRAANDQVEVEIPNLEIIDGDRNIDQPAASATISILNQKMRRNVEEDGRIPLELGDPGWFSFGRGDSPEAKARWDHDPNEWNHVLVEGALLRTYEGYGGHEKPLDQAIADGNVVLTGVWMVDKVRIATDGKLSLICRDPIKLLIEQQLYPPLVPAALYPLHYARWAYENVDLNAHGIDVSTATQIAPGPRYAAPSNSSVDMWYPQGAPGSNLPDGFVLHGHRLADAFDGNPDTYWLGEGNSRADAPFAVNYIEVDCGGEAVNAVYVHPWGGNYTMYISVMENGSWQGVDIVPYDPTEILGQSYFVNTGADIPFVSQQGVPWEMPKEYLLPRVYAAQKIRVSFRDLTDSGIGPYVFRAGVRELQVRVGSSGGGTTTTVQHLDTLFLAADAHPVSGYWVADTFKQVDAFGEARVYDPSTESNPTNRMTWAVRGTPSGNGYYTMDDSGQVSAYGDAVHHGDLPAIDVHVGISNNQALDMAVTPDGGGYWIVTFNGNIYAFGNATNFAASVPLTGLSALAACESDGHGGLWVMDTAGVVHGFGSASVLGSISPPFPAGTPDRVVEIATTLRRNVAGTGYWILTSEGRIYNFGTAPDLGGLDDPQPTGGDWRLSMWKIITNPTADTGYLVMRGDGTIFPIGDVDFYGGPAAGTAILRSDGNYLDYVDIIKDLALWSGFWLREALGATDEPRVYGNLESTGSYSNDDLPADLFDKRPVIDAMNAIKEIVGYIIWGDEEGAFRFECVDEETQALTTRGWVSGTDLHADDLVLSLNPDNGKSEWAPVKDVARYDVRDEDLVSIEGRIHSSLTTKNHRWWTTPAHVGRGRGRWTESAALSTESRIPIAAERGDAPAPTLSDELVELVAWWYTEGTIRAGAKSGVISQSARANPTLVKRIRRCFEQLGGRPGFLRDGHQWCEYDTAEEVVGWRFKGDLFELLTLWAPDRVPSMAFLTALSADQAKLFVDVSLLADGHTWGSHYSEFVQKDERRVASFEVACVLAGLAFRTRHYESRRACYRVKVARSRGIKPIGATRNQGAGGSVSLKPYTGQVWCPQLERNHIWLARRRGTVFFTGNSPNWWQSGNFDENGVHTDTIPEVDERRDLTRYGIETTDEPARSEIIVGSVKVDPTTDQTLYTRYIPPTAKVLRGMVKPAMWVNGYYTDPDEQRIMAELIALHIFFQMRQGSSEAWCNPAVQINDQVRIFERQTAETYIHYVRGKHSVLNMTEGTWLMTLTTNWLGTADRWVITNDPIDDGDTPQQFPISLPLFNKLQLGTYPSAVGRRGVDVPTVMSTPSPPTGTGAGPG